MAEDQVTEGVCLRRSDTGEHDAVVTFLTPDHGKVACVAKGLRRPRSRNLAACAIGAWTRLQLIARRGGLPVLGQTDLIESFHALRQDVWRSAYTTYLCDLTARALPDDAPQGGVYVLLVATLRAMLSAVEPEPAVHSYELRLLSQLGYEPMLSHCAQCGETIAEETAALCPSAGGLVHLECWDPRQAGVEVGPRVVKAMRRLLDPERYGLDLAHTTIPEPLAAPLRQAVTAFVKHHLEVEPKSLEFIERLRHDLGEGGGV